MLDTNAINMALDSGIEPAQLSDNKELYITHVQLNEIQATKNTERLNNLLSVFNTIEQESVPTAAAVWGVSEYGNSEYGDADGVYTAIVTELNESNGGGRGNARDALIAVTALKHSLVLVTNDKDLGVALANANGSAISFEEFTSTCS